MSDHCFCELGVAYGLGPEELFDWVMGWALIFNQKISGLHYVELDDIVQRGLSELIRNKDYAKGRGYVRKILMVQSRIILREALDYRDQCVTLAVVPEKVAEGENPVVSANISLSVSELDPLLKKIYEVVGAGYTRRDCLSLGFDRTSWGRFVSEIKRICA
jgi:hypothetical protein